MYARNCAVTKDDVIILKNKLQIMQTLSLRTLEVQEMEKIEGGSGGAQGVLNCIGAVYGGLGWFSVLAVAASVAEPGIGLAVVGGCLTAMR
jgi:hypothetical protein